MARTTPGGSGSAAIDAEVICVPLSDDTTALTTGAGKYTMRIPFACTIAAVRLSAITAPTGAAILVDVNEGGASIFSTRPSIAIGAKTSVGGTPEVITDATLADDAEITFDIDQVGSTIAGAGLKAYLYVTPTA